MRLLNRLLRFFSDPMWRWDRNDYWRHYTGYDPMQGTMVICGPPHSNSRRYRDAKLYKCARCGKDCAASLLAEEKLEVNPQSKPYCMSCALTMLDQAEG